MISMRIKAENHALTGLTSEVFVSLKAKPHPDNMLSEAFVCSVMCSGIVLIISR